MFAVEDAHLHWNNLHCPNTGKKHFDGRIRLFTASPCCHFNSKAIMAE
jgi:hypothetical protein